MLVHDAVIENPVLERAALDVMPDNGMVNMAVSQGETSFPADIDVVAVTVAESVVRECPARLESFLLFTAPRQLGVLVVMKMAAAQGKSRSFVPDSRAIAIGDRRSRKLDTFDRRVVPFKHPDRLALGAGAVGTQVRATADGTDREAALIPYCNVGWVDRRVDLHDIAVASDLRRLARP